MAKTKNRKPNKTYELVTCKRKHDYRILASDPGTRNYGIACVGVINDKIDVVANSLLTNPITSLTAEVMGQRDLYSAEIRQWFEMYDPNLTIAERFQTRGNGGPTIELVSTMNALLCAVRRIPYKYIPASQWKVAFNRRWGDDYLKGMYNDCLTTPHQLDSVLIGIYGLEYALRRELKYKPEKIIEMVETTSRLELRKPRK